MKVSMAAESRASVLGSAKGSLQAAEPAAFGERLGRKLEFQGEDGWGHDTGRVDVEALEGEACRFTVSTSGMLAAPRVFEGRREGEALIGSWTGAYGEQIDVRVLLGPSPIAALDIREIEDEPIYHFELAERRQG